MQHKSVSLLIKSADDQGGTFGGLASVLDNVDPERSRGMLRNCAPFSGDY